MDIYPEYKAGAGPAMAGRPQSPGGRHLQEILSAMNIPVVRVEGFEADDVLATMVAAGCPRGAETQDRDKRPGRYAARGTVP